MAVPDPSTGELKVVVKFLSALRDRTGVGEETLSLPAGATLRTVAEHLAQRRGLQVPASEIMATLNGRGWSQADQGLDTPLQDGDVIHLFPPISGG